MSRAFLQVPSKHLHLLRCSNSLSTKVVPAPDPIEQQLRRNLAIAHRLVAHNGHDELTWNHISARHESWETGKYLVTPGNTHFACMEPADLVLMGAGQDSGLDNITADVIHGAIYRARKDITSIVHVHTEAGMYISCLPDPDPLKYYTQDGGAFYGKVAYHDFEGVATDHEEQENIIRNISTKTFLGKLPDVLMMRQHGTTCCGSSVGAAYVKNFYLEQICRVQMNLDQGGAGDTAPQVSAKVLAKMAGQYERPDINHGLEWPAMVKYAEKFLGCDEF